MGPARSLLTCLIIVSLATACSSSSTSTPGPGLPHLYAAEPSANEVAVLAQPLSAASLPAFNIAGFNFNSGVAFDTAKNLYVTNTSGPTIAVFTPPYTSASTPSFTIAGVSSGLSIPEQLGFDAAGNLWVADQASKVIKYTPPFSAGSAPALHVMTGLSSPQGIAFDGAANLYVADNNGLLAMFASPYAAAPITTANGLQFPLAILTDATHVYVADFGKKGIVVYNTPLVGADAPVFTITNGLTNGPHGLTFDPSGNLLAGTNAGEIVLYSPPFSAASTPLFTIPCFVTPPGNCLTRQLAFGP
jgi:sugar lactone lactonase YvrE